MECDSFVGAEGFERYNIFTPFSSFQIVNSMMPYVDLQAKFIWNV